MKVWAAAVCSGSGDHYVFVSLTESGIEDQILELARCEYGDDQSEFEEDFKDDYLDYDHYLVSQYDVQAEREIDL